MGHFCKRSNEAQDLQIYFKCIFLLQAFLSLAVLIIKAEDQK